MVGRPDVSCFPLQKAKPKRSDARGGTRTNETKTEVRRWIPDVVEEPP